ncbi:MAG: S41 family peptidase [Patescibacteria group bacterium]|nr:S41 family peptidase [Patescibacteria group bacterium]
MIRWSSKKFKKAVDRASLVVLSIIVVVALGGGGYYFGFKAGAKTTKNIVVSGVSNLSTPSNINANFNVFWQVWDILKNDYLNAGALNNQSLVYGAVTGLTNSLNDPYTEFFQPSDSTQFNQDISGNFGGIGAEIDIKSGQLIVLAPLNNSPAAAAGLRANDAILAINGQSTQNLSLQDAVNEIRGDIGTTVTLTILRKGWNKPQDFKITRANIQVPTVDWKVIDNNILDLQLYSFNQNAEADFNNAVNSGIQDGAKGMILDLRNDPGGYLNVAVDLASELLPANTPVVIEENAQGVKQVIKTGINQSLAKMPVVVLINGGSASAAEILSGALRDNRGVLLVGEQSFGKGTVQEVFPLSDGSFIKVTIAKWLTPDGTWINGKGLKPDYVVPLTDANIAAGTDPQLAKAVELLKTEMQ